MQSVVNKVEISLPAKKNAEILWALQFEGNGQACRHPEVGGQKELGGWVLAPVKTIRPPVVGQSVQRSVG